MKHACLCKRVHGPWEFSLEEHMSGQAWLGPFQCPEVLPFKANWIEMAAEHVESDRVQNSSSPHPFAVASDLLWDLNLVQACLLAQAAPHSCKVPGVERPRRASQNLPSSPLPLLKVEKGPFPGADFWMGGSSYLSPGSSQCHLVGTIIIMGHITLNYGNGTVIT